MTTITQASLKTFVQQWNILIITFKEITYPEMLFTDSLKLFPSRKLNSSTFSFFAM